MKRIILSNNNFWLWLFTMAVAFILTLPVLIQNGMFMDAVQYSAVSRNLSEGHGSFWNLQFDLYNIHNLPSFSEQPPLAFGIQSLFFRIFGSSIYTERIYTFLLLLITIVLINKLWKFIADNNSFTMQEGWLPVLLWITIPIVFWSFRNNMLENSMGVFVLLSCIYLFKGMKSNKTFLNLFIAAFFIFLATLTKGLPGLFTICFPILYTLIYKNIKFLRSIMLSAYITVLIAGFYIILLLVFPESQQFFERYFLERTLGRIGTEANNEGPLFIVIALAQQLLFPILITILLLFFASKNTSANQSTANKNAAFLILLGLAGTIPMMLTPVQKQFYLTPALPFFAIGFALLIAPKIKIHLVEKLNLRSMAIALRSVSTLLIIATLILCIYNFGKVSRDEVYITDAKKISEQVKYESTIGSTSTVYFNWTMHSYLIRNHGIYLDHKNEHEYFLLDKRYDTLPSEKYDTVNSNLYFFELLEVKY